MPIKREPFVLQAKTIKESKFKKYLLPKDHFLQSQLKDLFVRPKMFNSKNEWRAAGFNVSNRVHRGLMVASHPNAKGYLFKKFQSIISQKEQLENFLERLEGADALRQFIQKRKMQHIIVPQKWLYKLPKIFTGDTSEERAYILIVEKIDLCEGCSHNIGQIAPKYYNMDYETLKELCNVVYFFRGLDSVLGNMPFTRQNQIAFIDTEKWRLNRPGYFRKAMPFLSPDRQRYALTIFKELEEINKK